MVGEALKGGRLLAAVAARCGIAASPPHGLLDRQGAESLDSLPIEMVDMPRLHCVVTL